MAKGEKPESGDVEVEVPPRAKRRTCFVIMPFGTKPAAKAAGKPGGGKQSGGRQAAAKPAKAAGDDRSMFRVLVPDGADRERYEIDFDKLYKEMLAPAIKAVDGYKITVERCDDKKYSGWIHKKMIEGIADADIAVVELTTLNPNVFYELGIRHALSKGVTVLLQQEGLGQNIPFNLGGMSVVRYNPDDPEPAMHEIEQAIAASLARRDHVDSLVFDTLPSLEVSVRRPRPIKQTDFLHYRLQRMPEGAAPRCVGIVTGDIANVTGIDVWVTSENTEMQMARHSERAISATVRYLGAKKDPANAVVEDTVYEALQQAKGAVTCVQPGTVVVTPAGELNKTHGVKWIFHAASVVGQVGQGYTAVPDPTACVRNALRQVDTDWFQTHHAEAFAKDSVKSIVMPLFGTGQARGDMEDAAAELFEMVIAHFRRHPDSPLTRVYFLAFDDETRDVCKLVLEYWPNDLLAEGTCPALAG